MDPDRSLGLKTIQITVAGTTAGATQTILLTDGRSLADHIHLLNYLLAKKERAPMRTHVIGSPIIDQHALRQPPNGFDC